MLFDFSNYMKGNTNYARQTNSDFRGLEQLHKHDHLILLKKKLVLAYKILQKYDLKEFKQF